MLSCRRLLLVALYVMAMGLEARAQTVLDRTPNLSGGWVGASGVLHFNFLHRFSISSAPERKVTNTPTFLLAAGLPARTLLGVHYATNSELSPRYPNEWEFFGRVAAFVQASGAPIDASAQLGYNLAAQGFDGEASLARRQGPVRILAALARKDESVLPPNGFLEVQSTIVKKDNVDGFWEELKKLRQ